MQNINKTEKINDRVDSPIISGDSSLSEEDINELKHAGDETDKSLTLQDILFSKTMEKAMKAEPLTKLFSNYINKNELTFFAGETGTGKTTLAFQIAGAISKGGSILNQTNESDPLRTLYLDYELRLHHYQARYANFNDYDEDNFFVPDMKEVLAEYDYRVSIDMIRGLIEISQARVLIIDNITAISNKPTSKQDEADRLIRELLNLCREGITVVVIAHTPKGTSNKPLHKDHIAGHSNLVNLADNAFMIGKSSKGTEYKYIKQVKFRSNADDGQILVLEQTGEPYLHFEYYGEDYESNHIPQEIEAQDRKADGLGELAEQVYDGKTAKSLRYGEIVEKLTEITGTGKDNCKKKAGQMSGLGIIEKDPHGKYLLANTNKW
jgi:predicted ATP-dependent serine protease